MAKEKIDILKDKILDYIDTIHELRRLINQNEYFILKTFFNSVQNEFNEIRNIYENEE